MKRDLVYQDGTSHKFWSISTAGKSFTVTFGRVGTSGQTQTKKLASDAACEKAASALVAEKLKKGYVDAGETKTAAPKKAAAPKDASAKPVTKKLSPDDAKALVRAIELGLVPKVKALLAKGNVDVVVPQKYGVKTTPLFDAARRANAEIVDLLLGAGANLANLDEYGQTVLHVVRDVAVAKKLLAAGADLGARDRRKQTPLHSVAELGDADLVELFLEHGAEVDAKDDAGKTPYVKTREITVRAVLTKFGSKGLPHADGRALKPKSRAEKPEEVDVDGGAIGVDADGDVWIAGSNAIFRWDGKKVTAFEFDESFSVSEVAAGGEGRVYFSTNWGLVVRSGDAWRLYGMQDSELHDQHITDMAVDRKGRACLMGYGHEKKLDRPVSVFDGKAFTLWTAGNDFPAGSETNRIAFDAANRIVLGGEKGLVFADGTKWKVPGEIGNLGAVNVLVADGDAVWAGAWRGAHRVTPDGKVTRSIKTPDGTKCILVTGDTVFVGMSYGGLLRVRGDDQRVFKGEESGLEEDDVQGLALGADGTVWIAAGSAVFQYRDDVVKRFDGKPFASGGAKPAPKAAPKPEPKPEPPPKKRKLAPLPSKPLVPRAKLPPHVVAAFEAAKLEGLSRDALFTLVRPAIGIVVEKAATISPGGSKLGGRPDLAPGTKWPTYEGESDRFLPLLFQIDLADVAKHDVEGLLPKKGRLCFFCDTQPDEIQDSRVVFDDGAKKPVRLDWPEDLVDRKNEDDFVAQLPEHALSFYPTWTLPSAEYFERHATLTDTDRRTLSDLEEKIHAKDPKGSSTSRLLGWPNTLQGEIVSSPDTIILFQIDGDMKGPKKLGELFGYWGNGITHYVIKGADLAAKKLGKAGVELAYT
jgi:predicted DNA-binding WGR domain protein/uncharacterized protein YwqG